MATIKDVSKAAGVSTASVSKVMNGNYTGVSAETKERILAVARQLRYRPNRLARGLVKNQTNILGLVLPDIANPFYAELAKGVEEEAEKLGYSVLLSNAAASPLKERKHVNTLIEYNVDGLVLTSMESYDAHSAEMLRDLRIPLVSVDRVEAEAPVSFYSDSRRGSFLATEHLLQMGHRHIAFIGGQASQPGPDQRLLGFESALQAYGVPVVPAWVRQGEHFTMESGYGCALLLLDTAPPPTAMVCANDLIAMGAIKAIRERGLDVPGDISVIGYDDIPLSSFLEPRLTTIRQDAYQLGRNVCAELHKLIIGDQTERIVRPIEPQLVIRETVRRLAAE